MTNCDTIDPLEKKLFVRFLLGKQELSANELSYLNDIFKASVR